MNNATLTNPLVAFVQKFQNAIEAERSRVASYEFQVPPEPEQPNTSRHRLQWQPAPADQATSGETVPIEYARQQLLNEMLGYEAKASQSILLVRAAPGLGKTYAAILTAQLVEGRVLYAMPTHAHFDQLRQFPVFKSEEWYHWLATDAPVPGGNGETMCRESKVTKPMMTNGWPLSVACEGICAFWKAQCHYRAQRTVTHKVIAGVHEHITTGLNTLDPFDFVIVDEEPMRAILRQRVIEEKYIRTSRYAGPITDFYNKLAQLCQSKGTYRGRTLLDQIGELLTEVYAMVADAEALLPAMPAINSRGDIEDLPAWFLDEILVLLAGELEAWRRGMETWLERVVIHDGRLYLYNRAELWDSLPAHVVIIDATAEEDVYRQMFPERKIRVWEPPTVMAGKIKQVTGSYLGISQMTDDTIDEMVALVAHMTEIYGYKQPGVVTFLKAVPAFARAFGTENVAHFGGQRGSNQLAECDAGFVVGSYSPPDGAIMDAAKMLNPQRVNPFAHHTLESGVVVPIRSERLVGYRLRRNDGMAPFRFVSGLWHDPDLNAIMRGRRESEMVQAAHRFRPLTRNVPVWIFSSVPTDMRLDEIYDDPPIGPEEINWRVWLRLYPWLKEQGEVTYATLAEVAGVTLKYAQNMRWLDAIVGWRPELWQVTRITQEGSRGWRKGISTKLPAKTLDS